MNSPLSLFKLSLLTLVMSLSLKGHTQEEGPLEPKVLSGFIKLIKATPPEEISISLFHEGVFVTPPSSKPYQLFNILKDLVKKSQSDQGQSLTKYERDLLRLWVQSFFSLKEEGNSNSSKVVRQIRPVLEEEAKLLYAFFENIPYELADEFGVSLKESFFNLSKISYDLTSETNHIHVQEGMSLIGDHELFFKKARSILSVNLLETLKNLDEEEKKVFYQSLGLNFSALPYFYADFQLTYHSFKKGTSRAVDFYKNIQRFFPHDNIYEPVINLLFPLMSPKFSIEEKMDALSYALNEDPKADVNYLRLDTFLRFFYYSDSWYSFHIAQISPLMSDALSSSDELVPYVESTVKEYIIGEFEKMDLLFKRETSRFHALIELFKHSQNLEKIHQKYHFDLLFGKFFGNEHVPASFKREVLSDLISQHHFRRIIYASPFLLNELNARYSIFESEDQLIDFIKNAFTNIYDSPQSGGEVEMRKHRRFLLQIAQIAASFVEYRYPFDLNKRNKVMKAMLTSILPLESKDALRSSEEFAYFTFDEIESLASSRDIEKFAMEELVQIRKLTSPVSRCAKGLKKIVSEYFEPITTLGKALRKK